MHVESIYPFLLVLVVLILAYFMIDRFKNLQNILNGTIIKNLFQNFDFKVLKRKYIIIIASMLLLILALANPYIGSKNKTINQDGIDVVVAVDVSKSMLAEDILPSRIARTRIFLSELFENLNGDRVGLVIFAGNAYIQVPLTNDYSIFELYLSSLEPGMVPTQGTAISDALEVSEELFDKKTNKYRAIILLTDGETHDNDALSKARKVAKNGATIYTVGVGDPKGSPIALSKNTYLKDENGKVVLSKLNEKLLKNIAKSSNGIYFNIKNEKKAIRSISNHINKMEGRKYGTTQQAQKGSLYMIFAFLALCLLLVEYLGLKLSFFKKYKKPFITLVLLLILPQFANAQNIKFVIQKGNKAYFSQDFKTAEKYYNAALKIDSSYTNAQFNKGCVAYKQKQYKDAVLWNEKVIQNTNASFLQKAKAYTNMGNAFFKQNDFQKSVEAYKQSLRLNPDNIKTKYNYALALHKLKKDKNQDKDKDKNQDKNKDQNKNKDADKDKDKNKEKDKEKDQNKKDQPEKGKNDSKEKDQKQQQTKLDKSQIEQLLNTMDQQEKNVQQKLMNGAKGTYNSAKDKDW
jgi:Mg-chelatase subunit ChlD